MEEVIYISAYDETRRYGGAEEGGWWFEVGTLLECIKTTRREYRKMDQYLVMKYYDKVQSPYYPDYHVLKIIRTSEPGENYPKGRPHYE